MDWSFIRREECFSFRYYQTNRFRIDRQSRLERRAEHFQFLLSQTAEITIRPHEKCISLFSAITRSKSAL